jgi:hypothetical protein
LTQGTHLIDTEAAAASDNLDTLAGGIEGAIYILACANTSHEVVVRSGAGNIRTYEGVSRVLNTEGKFIVVRKIGSVYQVLGTIAEPNHMQPYGLYPDSFVNVAVQEAGGDFYYINGDEIREWAPYTLTTNISFDAAPFLHLLFNSSTAFTMTINAGTVVEGMEWKVQVLTAPGAGTHKLLLPSGVTFDGSNRAAIFDNTADYLRGSFISSTRFLLEPTTTGVTYAAS